MENEPAEIGNTPMNNPIFGQAVPPPEQNEDLITPFLFAAKVPEIVPPGDERIVFGNTVFPDIPRTRFCANDHVRLTKLIRSMTDEIECLVNKIAEDPNKCNADKYAEVAIACKQAQFMVRSAFVEVNTAEAKELAEMVRRYDQTRKSYV